MLVNPCSVQTRSVPVIVRSATFLGSSASSTGVADGDDRNHARDRSHSSRLPGPGIERPATSANAPRRPPRRPAMRGWRRRPGTRGPSWRRAAWLRCSSRATNQPLVASDTRSCPSANTAGHRQHRAGAALRSRHAEPAGDGEGVERDREQRADDHRAPWPRRERQAHATRARRCRKAPRHRAPGPAAG